MFKVTNKYNQHDVINVVLLSLLLEFLLLILNRQMFTGLFFHAAYFSAFFKL